LGLEIGQLSTPFKFTNARMLYVDIAIAQESRKELDYFARNGELYIRTLCKIDSVLKPPRFEFDHISDSCFDFNFSYRDLEHSNSI
jgi:hypothetical protein